MPVEGVDGNWRCPACSNINLGVRERCNRCALPKSSEMVANGVGAPLPKRGAPIEGVDGNWRCTSCGNINFRVREKCNRCAAPRASVAAQYIDASGQVYQMGLDGQLGLSNNNNGNSLFPRPATAAPAMALQNGSGNNTVAQLEAQVALLVRRQSQLENQVNALQTQVVQQGALLSSAGLTPSALATLSSLSLGPSLGASLGVPTSIPPPPPQLRL